MADPFTPLVAPRNDGDATSPSMGLQVYHWVFLVVLALLTFAALISTLTNIWAFLSALLTLAAIAHIGERIFRRLCGTAPKTFLITQATLGAFVAPLAVVLLSFVCVLALLIPTVVLSAIVGAIFAAMHPDAMRAFAEDMQALSEQGPAALGIARDAAIVLARSAVVVATGGRAISTGDAAPKVDLTPEQVGQLFKRVWADVQAAGASPFAMGLTIAIEILILIVFGIVVMIAVSAVKEYVKWRLFTRYVKVPDSQNDERAPAAQQLGVNGLALVALTGAYAFATIGVVSNVFGLAKNDAVSGYRPSLYVGIVFFSTSVLDVLVLVGSQLLVATAHAEHMLLEGTASMWDAWKLSILYNFGLLFLRVPTPGTENPVPTPVLLFIIMTAARALIVQVVTKKWVARYEAAVTASPPTAAAAI